ncbi:hypothetical protein L210DRAFT_3571243 [Boletus edulis BED1]|uniref:Uncharacterized protein n=1 Tax=Boletus edulis BED1 TaxID=1328754 RepID=A0AAD4BDV7_BOLED|nr:hypothetical protein L210DRAFT_3571243 [Boletus edulis BED1]
MFTWMKNKKGSGKASRRISRHFLHPDVVQFVKTGVVPSPSQRAFCHVFTTGVAAGSSERHTWSPYILATADSESCKTIQESESVKGEVNPYLRPVRWVISLS